MKNQFAPYELAVKLKELGFDEGCHAIYIPVREDMFIKMETSICRNSHFTQEGAHVTAPLWQQALDWIRSNYNITFWIEPCGGWIKKAHLWEYVIVTHDNKLIGTRSEYHEEQEALLRKLIEIIEKGEHKE